MWSILEMDFLFASIKDLSFEDRFIFVWRLAERPAAVEKMLLKVINK